MAPPLNVKIEGADGVGVHHSILDLELMKEHVNVVHPQAACDFRINFTKTGPKPWSQTVLAYMEPPLGPGYTEPYTNAQQFHTVYTFFPHKPNQFAITNDAIVFPHPPNTAWDRNRGKRIREKGPLRAYFAGAKGDDHKAFADRHYRHNFYGLREPIVTGLMQRGVDVTLYGRGWDGRPNTRLTGDFQHNKIREVDACDPDFILCMDNSSLQNYISEKIHNGFQSGCGVCYLGEPLIHTRVPEEAFINMNSLCNPVTKAFDHALLFDVLRDTRWDTMIEAAREWRLSGLEERRQAQSTRLTRHILGRLGCL